MANNSPPKRATISARLQKIRTMAVILADAGSSPSAEVRDIEVEAANRL
jgi:hypothetical protein